MRAELQKGTTKSPIIVSAFAGSRRPLFGVWGDKSEKRSAERAEGCGDFYPLSISGYFCLPGSVHNDITSSAKLLMNNEFVLFAYVKHNIITFEMTLFVDNIVFFFL